MFKKKERFSDIGKVKRHTNSVVDDALEKQLSWKKDKRDPKGLIPAKKNETEKPSVRPVRRQSVVMPADNAGKNVFRSYWFPIVCAVVILALILWAFWPVASAKNAAPAVPEPTTHIVAPAGSETADAPAFDLVRIQDNGHIVAAGHHAPSAGVSIRINNKIVATEMADKAGDFVYAPARALAAGNHTIQLVAVDTNKPSENKVFIYISEKGDDYSMSLLMTQSGSTLMQAPALADGDLVVSKIDYLKSGRIVAMGRAIPRLRVSLVLDGRELGFARVSDYKNFGLGADVGTLTPGREYDLAVRLHDGDGKNVATVTHKFVMPKPTGADDTFYTVRRGDALWIIARNFLGRGVLFSIIAEKNNIKKPDLIYPDQKLQIPVQ